MKSRTRTTWKLARLGRRLDDSQQFVRFEKRKRRGHAAWLLNGMATYSYCANHHEPLHEAKMRPPAKRQVAPTPRQVQVTMPDLSILVVAAQAKRKRMVR